MRNGSQAQERVTELPPENAEPFQQIGGVFLGPVPEIEKEFYEALLEELHTAAEVRPTEAVIW